MDYAARTTREMDMELRRTLEAYGVSRVSDIVRYGEEFIKGTRRTKGETITRDKWNTLEGREIKVCVKNKWTSGWIVRYEAPVFVVDYGEGELMELAPNECIDALSP